MSIPFAPHDYQRTGIKWLVQHPAAALFVGLGLGKSSMTLAAFLALRKAGAVGKALVIAPRAVCFEVWSASGEVGKWDQFKDLRVALLHGDDKAERLEEDADLYVINPDGLRWLMDPKTPARMRSLLARGVNLLVIDELSQFKNTQSQRAKILRPWLRWFKRRCGLTGTPAANGLEDVFGQAYQIDLGASLGQYITGFRRKYFVPGGFKGKEWTIQEGAEERIYDALKPIAISMRASDHLDLPPLVERDVFVVLPKKAREVYDQVEEDWIAEIEAGTVVAGNGGVASGKCRQVASGGLYYETEIERITEHLHDAKTDRLESMVSELQGQPLLVAYDFDHDLERIRARLGDVPAINGRTTPKKLREIIEAWNLRQIPVLCGHPASMGHGLNLQGGSCSNLAWYSLPWNLEHYEQVIGRVHRQGSKASRIMVHRLIARDTIDQVIAAVLAGKASTQGALLDALKAYVRKRRAV